MREKIRSRRNWIRKNERGRRNWIGKNEKGRRNWIRKNEKGRRNWIRKNEKSRGNWKKRNRRSGDESNRREWENGKWLLILTALLLAIVYVPKGAGGWQIWAAQDRIQAQSGEVSENRADAGFIGLLGEPEAHESPKFQISYNEAYRVVKRDGNIFEDSVRKTPQTGYTSYYNDQIEVRIIIEEFGQALSAEPGIDLTIYQDGRALLSDELLQDDSELFWIKTTKEEVTVYQGSFCLTADGRYQIVVKYGDADGNPMEAGDLVQGSESDQPVVSQGEEGVYTSTLLVLDTHSPEISMVLCEGEHRTAADPALLYEETERAYYDCPLYLQIHVDDRLDGQENSGNVQYQEFLEALNVELVNANGEVVQKDKALLSVLDGYSPAVIEENEFIVELPLTQEANYNVLVEGFEDLAGNRVKRQVRKVAVDQTAPDIALSFAADDENGYVKQQSFGDTSIIFADGELQVTVAAADGTSGIEQLTCKVVCGDQEEVCGAETVSDWAKEGEVWSEMLFYESAEAAGWAGKQTYTFRIPLEDGDFNGGILIKARDWMGYETIRQQKILIESEKSHRQTAAVSILPLTAPSRIVDGVAYYNTDVDIEICMTDGFSGICEYTVYQGEDEVIAENLIPAGTEDIKKVYRRQLTLSGNKANGTDQVITVTYGDYTNHQKTAVQQFRIDTTPPCIDVRYDQNDPVNGCYYASARTAAVTVVEPNFDPGDATFQIYNTKGSMPTIGPWSKSGSGDDTTYTCTITYEADGDYMFTMEVQDLAGNRALYHQTDRFIIDRTAPVCTISYDNNQSENEYYYQKTRKASICIRERNFDSAHITVEVTKDGHVYEPEISEWMAQGDDNRLFLSFEEDGVYTLKVSGTDLAENPMLSEEQDLFVIDQTPPELEIRGVEDQSANNGVVAPQIVFWDDHYDETKTEVIYEGFHTGRVKYDEAAAARITLHGGSITLPDMEYSRAKDDLYRVKVIVRDKAGNETSAEKIFSVNRFGSIYTFADEKTKRFLKDGVCYAAEGWEIHIMETNVDTLEERQVILNRDGKLMTLQEGLDYEIERTGGDGEWNQYLYTLAACNFEKEGHYIVKLLSKDRAMNRSDNDTGDCRLEFVIDRTVPSIVVTGIEAGEWYQTRQREVTVQVEDNVRLTQVQLYLDDELLAIYDETDEAVCGDGIIRWVLTQQKNPQNFKVVAVDAAGNVGEAVVDSVTISTSREAAAVKTEVEYPVHFVMIPALAVLAGGFVLFQIRRKG